MKGIYFVLCDDGGSNMQSVPCILPIGTIFKHDYGTYEVIEYFISEGLIQVICERISK